MAATKRSAPALSRQHLEIVDIRAAVATSPFRWVLVQVRTSSGLTGIGETWYTPGVLETLAEIRPRLIGEDGSNIEMLVAKLLYGRQAEASGMDWEACISRYGIALGAVLEGPTTMAVRGVEIALWDLLGKALDVPVFTLLGGRFRTRIRMYADLHLPRLVGGAVEASVQAAREAVEAGFDALKVDLDLQFPEHHRDPWNKALSGQEIALCAELLRAVRGEVGSEVDIAADCHWQFTPADAIRLVHALEEFDLFWLEDPVHPGNPETMSAVARASRVPICTGEYVATGERLHPYLSNFSCSIIHPDVCYAGLTDIRRMSALAEVFSVPCALHNSGGPIATAASAHLAAATRMFLVLEHHNLGVPWWRDLVRWEGVEVDGGYLDLRDDGRGLGVELVPQACRRYVEDADTLF
jgi:L-alanine-DL-glutamate epimerase-like enolase superfamily enzyme